MKIFMLKPEDLDALVVKLDRDPRHGADGGSSRVLTKVEELAFAEAHKFYNYQVRKWIESISK